MTSAILVAPAPRAPDQLVVTVTPSRAQAFSTCAYRFAHEQRPFDATNRALQMGQWIHEVIHYDNLARMDGREPPADEVVAHRPPPAPLVGGNDEDRALDIAAGHLRGYRAFLEAQGVETILDAERYVRTPTRPVAGVERCAIVLAGRFDVIAARGDGSVACIDVKTGNVPTRTRLAESPGTFIYHHLTDYTYGARAIDIVQINPLTKEWADVRLDERQIEAGKDFCRRMAATIKERSYTASPGDYCAYCTLAPRCPAHQTGRDGWNTAF
jgi:hypothetical protein